MFAIFFTFLLFGFHDIIADVSFPDTENPNQDRFVINAVIHQLFEQFRSLVKNGDINKNIPVLDPYELYSSTYQIDGGFVSVSLNISNGVFSGLGAFKRGPLTFQKRNLSIEVELTFPLLSFSSDDYELEGKVFEIFPLSGKGMMQIEVRNMVIKGKIYLKQSVDEKSILVSDFENLEFTIKSIEPNLTTSTKMTSAKLMLFLEGKYVLDAQCNLQFNGCTVWRFFAPLQNSKNTKRLDPPDPPDSVVPIEVDITISGTKCRHDESLEKPAKKVNADLSVPSIQTVYMHLSLVVGASHTEFDGNIDEIANAMIAELLPDYLTRFSRAICATYGGVMVQALNSILDKYDTWKIIAIIL